jgi:hypothetical protein
MSKQVDNNIYAPGLMGPGGPFSSNILNLIIFVLIVLQFGTGHHKECEEEDNGEIDNSILFVIALFFLFVCSCGSNSGCGLMGRNYC